jgi:hypothetical protein
MIAHRLRWVLLGLALMCLFAGLWWTAGPLLSGDHGEGSARIAPLLFLPTPWLAAFLGIDSEFQDYRVQLALFLGLLLVTQWMFLRPRRGWKVQVADTARPMRTAVAAAAFMAMMLSFGAIAVSMELFGVWDDVAGRSGRTLVGAVVVLWLLWTIVSLRTGEGARFEQLRTMLVDPIVRSTELFVAVGVFVETDSTTVSAFVGRIPVSLRRNRRDLGPRPRMFFFCAGGIPDRLGVIHSYRAPSTGRPRRTCLPGATAGRSSSATAARLMASSGFA